MLALYGVAVLFLVVLADDSWVPAKRIAGGVGALAAAAIWTVALIRR